MSKSFDIVFIGISSYTGRLLAGQLARRYGFPSETLRYAFAGGDLQRMQDVIKEMSVILGKGGKIEAFQFRLENLEDLRSICQKTKVVASMRGPYCQYGEPVIKCCVETGAGYLDITGEIDWIAAMKQKYEETAIANRACIIPFCGFDYVPNDLMFHQVKAALVNQYPRHPPHFCTEIQPSSISCISGGTARTIIASMIHSSLDPYTPLCKPVGDKKTRHKSSLKVFPQWMKTMDMYGAPNIMGPGMEKYTRWLNELSDYPMTKQMTVDALFGVTSLPVALFLSLTNILLIILFYLCSRFTVLRFWVPAPGKGPSKAKESGSQVNLKSVVKLEATPTHSASQVETEVSYPFGGAYTLTALTLLEAAICLAKNEPKKVGFTSPCIALGNNYVDRLKEQGVRIT